MAISQSVLPQERIIMEASRKFYAERLHDELNSLIAYKKQAETCKEKNELVSPIPRYDRYMLPIPIVIEPENKEQIEEKPAKRSRSAETRRRRSRTTEGGMFQKRERINVSERRNVLDSLKKVQGWIENNNAKAPSQSDEPSKEEITEKLAAITLRDERDAMLENEMKDMRDRVAVVPPVCSLDLQATISREPRPVKASSGKMVSVKTSVISLEISGPADTYDTKSKSNVGLTMAMKRVDGDWENSRKVETDEGVRSGGMLGTLDIGGCDTSTNPDLGTERISNWQEFQNFEAGDQLLRAGNLGVWDCDRLEKVTKFDGDLATVDKNENIAKKSVLNFENSEKLKSIALKLSDYTKLKSMAVTVGSLSPRMRKSNDNSKQELISIKTSDIFPRISRNNKVLGNELQRNNAKEDRCGEQPQGSSKEISQMIPQKRRPYVGARNYVHHFPIRAISSYNHPSKQTKTVRSFGTSTEEPQRTDQTLQHSMTQHDAFVKDDANCELIEILPPQFRTKDKPQTENKVITCDYQGMKHNPCREFDTLTESSDEELSLAMADRRRKVMRKKRKAHFALTVTGGDSDGWSDSESQRVSEMLKELDISPGEDHAQIGLESCSLNNLSALATQSSQLGKHVINESPRRGKQGDCHKPEWFRNYTDQKLNHEGSVSVKQVGKIFNDQRVECINLDQMTQQEIKKHSNRNSYWDKRITPRSTVKDETLPSSLDIRIPKGILKNKDTAHFNSPSRDEIRDRNPVCVVSASATSVTNVVLLGKPSEGKSPLHSMSSHRRNVAKKLGFTPKTSSAALPKEVVKYQPHSQNSFDKRKVTSVKRSNVREISTSADDFNKKMASVDDLESDLEDRDQTRTLSQANLFTRPRFTLDPLREIRNKSRNATPYSIDNSNSSKSNLDELKRLPSRRRVSNEELTKTKNEINSLLSKTSEILLRNDTEQQMTRRGNSLSLYSKMTTDLPTNSLSHRNAKTDCGLTAISEDALLTDGYTGGHGYESDESITNCPMNSLVSLLSCQRQPADDTVGKNFLPKRVAANMNLLELPDNIK